MSVSGLRPPRPLGSVSGLLQVASLFGLVLLLLKAAQLYLRRRWLLKAFQEFPCPPSHWLYGHSWEVGRRLLKRVEKFPRASLRWLWGSKVLFMVYDPDYMKVILGRSGYGLLLLNGQTWFQHRRMLTPAFHYNILKPYVGLMAESVRVMLDKWEELLSQGSHLEIFGHIFLMTLDTIMKSTPPPGQRPPSTVVSPASSPFRDLQSYTQAVEDRKSLAFFRLRNACQLAHQHTCFVINLRKAHLQKEGELEKVRKKRHLDFLDILLTARMENGSSVSDADLHAEVDMFMFEGHDTIASGISWILYALVTHPEHQQRPCLPFRMGFGFRDHLDQMPDTTMCIKEALELSKPLTFPDGRSLLTVMLSFYALHYNPEVWPNPESEPTSHFASPPWPGNCIGKQFAMNELKVAVALTLLRFELSPYPPRVPVPIPRIVLKSKNGFHLHLRKLL
uniref:Uncharacterized protein n=1 Tax=Equus asinus TaxID=9793 RepID=A0A8C4LRG1_EQUAS